jgi:hypothetical protein
MAIVEPNLSVQLLLRRLYRPLIQQDPRHRWMVPAWIVIYSFVGIQMGWVLRPFIGSGQSDDILSRGRLG